MKKALLSLISVLIFTLVLAGCGAAPATPPAPTLTPTTLLPTVTETVSPLNTATADPCSSGQIQAEVQKVHKHMREFDDASELASHIARDQISSSIADLQRIRREAEDEVIPPCLTNLKKYQIEHMNTVIQTFLAFMGGANQQTLDQGMALGGQQHDQYVLELARLLGLTIVPATVPSGPVGTATP